jgi:hypothetical protein
MSVFQTTFQLSTSPGRHVDFSQNYYHLGEGAARVNFFELRATREGHTIGILDNKLTWRGSQTWLLSHMLYDAVLQCVKGLQQVPEKLFDKYDPGGLTTWEVDPEVLSAVVAGRFRRCMAHDLDQGELAFELLHFEKIPLPLDVNANQPRGAKYLASLWQQDLVLVEVYQHMDGTTAYATLFPSDKVISFKDISVSEEWTKKHTFKESDYLMRRNRNSVQEVLLELARGITETACSEPGLMPVRACEWAQKVLG